MAKLHPKLERDAALPQYILTETGVGYRLSAIGYRRLAVGGWRNNDDEP